MKIEEYPDRDMLMIDLANHLAGEINAAIMVNDSATFAVPGGSTPGPIFDVLSAADLDWSKVLVLPTDERWVPESAPESNAALIRNRLLTGRAAAASFMPFYLDGVALEDGAALLSAQLAPRLSLSVVLLGMGGDMHTASLFPGDAEAIGHHHKTSPILCPVKMPGLAPFVPRMTLTPAALNGAMSKHLLITGADKREALERAQKLGDPVAAPILSVLSGMTVHWAE
jgi:6-phosphogluconolactonase